MNRAIFLLLILTLTPVFLHGQTSATATFTASVTIIEPIEVKTTSNMNFSTIDARNGGSVTLFPDNSRSAHGDVKLEAYNNASAAIFEIKGQNGYSYNVSIPQGDYVMLNGSKSITLKDFKLAYNPRSLNKNTQIIRLGATIDVMPGQKPGKYSTPTPIEITVSYN